MPFEATFSDIAKFFSGLNICSGGILILLSRRGLKTGEALVLFEDEENSELAYRRNKCHMASRYLSYELFIFNMPLLNLLYVIFVLLGFFQVGVQ